MSDREGHLLPDIVERHAAEAAFCWSYRDAAVRSPAYDLAELCDLDDRLECHMDGLRAAGDLGWELCLVELSDPYPGVLFPATILAVERRDWPGFARVLDAGATDPARARALSSALGFLPFEALGVVWTGMLAQGSPAPLLHLAAAGHAIHRRDPGPPLARLATDSDPRVRARALRAVGELSRTDLLRLLIDSLSDPDETIQLCAAWSAVLLRDSRGAATLATLALNSPSHAEEACAMAVRALPPADARRLVEQVAARPDLVRAALRGAAALGDPALLPWLASQAAVPETARLAAFAIRLITGASEDDLSGAGKPPEGFDSGPTDDPDDEDVSEDPDSDLPWPDPARLTAFLASVRLPEGTRHLLGKPMEPVRLRQLLRSGNQAVRAACAVELTLRLRGEPLFEVRAPGYRQLAALPS
ncbi:MAG: TIGR02270 family protein [Polyangiaceae bacterium]